MRSRDSRMRGSGGICAPCLAAMIRSIGAMLQEPVLEGAHPFVAADATMAALAGSLLHPDLVAALDGLPARHDYRFPRTRKPFLHQAEAWRFLRNPNRSPCWLPRAPALEKPNASSSRS